MDSLLSQVMDHDGSASFSCLSEVGTPYPPKCQCTSAGRQESSLLPSHRFVCITDVAEGLSPDVEVMELPEIPIERKKWATGYWPKLAVFKKGMFAENEIILYLDVDIVIVESLNPLIDLIDQEKGLRIIREWNPDIWRLVPVWMRPDRGGNGSVIGFIAVNRRTCLMTSPPLPKKRTPHTALIRSTSLRKPKIVATGRRDGVPVFGGSASRTGH